MQRNQYDDAYIIGYTNGYHHDGYMNEYDKDKQPQYHIKYKHGYEDGELMRIKEQSDDRLH